MDLLVFKSVYLVPKLTVWEWGFGSHAG